MTNTLTGRAGATSAPGTRTRLGLVVLAAAAAVLVPSAVHAGPAAPIPPEWGGGSVSVDLPDFTYPAADGCYQVPGALGIVGNDIYAWDYYVADLTVTDSIGRITDSFYEFEEFATTVPLSNQLCHFLDTPGTYTLSGVVRFEDYPYSLSVPVSDTFTIRPYAAPAAPPTAGPSARCLQARKALRKAKRLDKPYSVIKKLKKQVTRFC